jgi:hypothetical protein
MMHPNLKASNQGLVNPVPQIQPALTPPVSPTVMSISGSQIADSQVLLLTLLEVCKSMVGL